MIIHSIEKYTAKKPTYLYTPTFTPPKTTWEMGKLEYALYISKLPYKVGDWVVSKHVGYPLLKREIYKVVNIDELHRFVTYQHPDIGPMCLTLANAWGQTLSTRHGGNLYRKVEEDEFPLDFNK